MTLDSANTIADGTAVKRVGETIFHTPRRTLTRILTVEDDELIRKELSRFLTYEGYEAVCIEKFENDFQTAESIFQETPDLVLLDVSLPGCDGLFICDELRSRSDVPDHICDRK
mgnify:CR=1 FL=1